MSRRGLSRNFKLFFNNGKANAQPTISIRAFYDRRFSNYATVIPLKERKAPDIMAALLRGFKEIGKQPEVLYTGEEGALMQKDVAPEFEKMGVQHITTAGSAHFVERFNRTFKWMINQQVTELKRKND